jgi:hypothetical protein
MWFFKRELGLAVVLGAFITLAGAVRFWGLSDFALTNDEAYSWRITQYPAAELVQRSRYDANPPLYYLVLQAWEGVCGTSPLALRGLSALLTIACLPLSYLTCVSVLKLGRCGALAEPGRQVNVQACHDSAPGRAGLLPDSRHVWAQAGALFAVFILAVHASQVVPGRTARMYGLGVLLACLTSWLLLKSLQTSVRQLEWSTAYGVAAAAFVLTHNYAFFSLAAQGLFVAVYLFCKLRSCKSELRSRAEWALFAAILASVLYAPWVPSLLGQIGDVRASFWIPDVTTEDLGRLFWPWCSGLQNPVAWEKTAWFLVLLLCLAWTILSRDLAGFFFLAQATMPWFFGLVLSVAWGRAILYDRYLAFAHWALLCYWGITCSRLPGRLLRLTVACFIAASVLAGLPLKTSQTPPALLQAAEFLRKHALLDDVVWVPGPADVNLMRYYTSQVGLLHLEVKCPVHLGGKGHQVHLASLSGEDVLGDEPLKTLPKRFWMGSVGVLSSMSGRRLVLRNSFHDEVTQYHLALYERAEGP